MILTAVGEIGVHAAGVDYKLRPSLYAMSKLGEPRDIVRVFVNVMSEPPDFTDALGVLFACCEDDVSEVFGYNGLDGKYIAGAASQDDVVPLARCLLKHGVTSALPALPVRADAEDQYTDEFDARACASLAIAHLGMTSEQAWSMTMTEIMGALRAKFPQIEENAPGARAPNSQELQAVLDWHDKVEEKRRKRQGAH